MLDFHPDFYFRHNLDGSAALYPKDVSWYSFLLEAEWTPGL
jgi:hypothetical protein